MSRYCFRIHYERDSLPIGNVPSDSDEISAALIRFQDDLPGHLAALGASAELAQPLQLRQSAIRLTVTSGKDWQEIYLAMVGFAVRYGLRVTLIRTGLLRVAPFAPLVKPRQKPAGALLRPVIVTDAGPRLAPLS